MNFDDKDKGNLPRHFGETGGRVVANKMLFNTDGSDSFKTRTRTIDLGDRTVTTTLRTKDGMPRLDSKTTSRRGEVTEEEEKVYGYMETGELTWGFAAENDDILYAPATWRLNNVPLEVNGDLSLWLGKVDELGKQRKKQPTPADTNVLRDEIDSLAIGHPRQLLANGLIDAANDTQVRNEYGPMVAMKKLVCGIFPPEMFSGKLRKFIQAQYGAMLDKNRSYYSVEVLGESALLHYQPDNGPMIQFGFWAHGSTGLYTAPDHNYYLLQVSPASRAGVYRVVGMPIKLSAFGKKVRKALLKGGITDVEKAEAYMFADAVIETDKQFVAAELGVGVGNTGATLAFGWKFDRGGRNIRIVMVGSVGETTNNTLDGRASEHHIVLERSSVFDGTEDGKWSASATSNPEQPWLDGWGYFNIFVPQNEVSTALEAYSYKITLGTVSDYAFSNVPIYGFYTKDDVWTTVKVSSVVRTGTKYEQRSSGVILAPGTESESDTDYPASIPWKESCIRPSNGSGWVEQRVIYDAPVNFKEMTITVGDWSYTGTFKTGTFYREEDKLGSGSSSWPSTWQDFGEGSMVGTNYTWPPALPSYSAEYDATLGGYPDNGYLSSKFKDERVPITFYQWSGSFDERKVWTLVIPCGDCEAVHTMIHSERSDSMSVQTAAPYDSWGAAQTLARYVGDGSGNLYLTFDHPQRWIKFRHWVSPPTFTFTPVLPEHENTTAVHAWSRSLNGQTGSPSGSYATLFSVDRTWPYFNGTIRYKESFGGRYHGTEGYNSGGVLKNSLFVGWY